MQITAHSSAVSETAIEPISAPQPSNLRLLKNENSPAVSTPKSLSVPEIKTQGKDWICDCQYRQHSVRTIEARELVLDKLVWFLTEKNYADCGLPELRRFLVYIANSHDSEEGRWNDPNKRTAVRPRTLHTWHGHLRTFFTWLVKEEVLTTSPMERIAPPVCPTDQIQPFSQEEVEAYVRAARRSNHPRRDEAIILLLFDTGLRASELCSIRIGALDMDGRQFTVVGKGNKRRTVYFGRRTARALGQFLREQTWQPEQAVFCGNRGTEAGEALTRSGLLQLIKRLGKVAGIQNVRCSPHTFRHTFAVSFLRNGGNVFTLQYLLGHTSLDMTNRYVAFAQADIENQHRQFAPADRLGK